MIIFLSRQKTILIAGERFVGKRRRACIEVEAARRSRPTILVIAAKIEAQLQIDLLIIPGFIR